MDRKLSVSRVRVGLVAGAVLIGLVVGATVFAPKPANASTGGYDGVPVFTVNGVIASSPQLVAPKGSVIGVVVYTANITVTYCRVTLTSSLRNGVFFDKTSTTNCPEPTFMIKKGSKPGDIEEVIFQVTVTDDFGNGPSTNKFNGVETIGTSAYDSN